MKNNLCPREVVVAQLAERSPTIPEDPGSNPVIGNFYLNIYLLLTVCRKDENKEKEAENGPFLKKNFFYDLQMCEEFTFKNFSSTAQDIGCHIMT